MKNNYEANYPMDNILKSWVMNHAANAKDLTDIFKLEKEIVRVPILAIHKNHAQQIIAPYKSRLEKKRPSKNLP